MSAAGEIIPRQWAEQTLAAALDYAAAGVPVIPIKVKGKQPLAKWKLETDEATTDPEQIRRWWSTWPNAGIATQTGTRSGLFVYDIDEKNGVSGSNTLAALGVSIPAKSPIVHTPSGGRHAYFAAPAESGISAGKIGPGVDTRGEGGIVVLPPSVSRLDGGSYRLNVPMSVADFIAAARACPLPAPLVAILPPKKVQPERIGRPLHTDETTIYGRKQLERLLSEIRTEPGTRRRNSLNESAFQIARLVAGGEINEEEAIAALEAAADETGLAAERIDKTIADAFRDGLAKPKAGPAQWLENLEEADVTPPESSEAVSRQPAWKSVAITNKNKEPMPIVANVVAALKTDPALMDCFAFDEMLYRPVIIKALPHGSKVTSPRQIEDNDITRLQIFMQVHGVSSLNSNVARQGVLLRASERSYHPVREYLRSLRWDGQARLQGWLTTYLSAERTAYHDGIGAMALIAMVARVMRPGCKCDYALILEGPQGARKSSACAIMAGEWFSDALPDVRDRKEAAQHLSGKWLIEIAEMSAISKTESAALKAFMTRTDELYRPPYGHFEIKQPRQCVFWGTTNTATYLRDETGGRRFWPVKVGGKIDLEGLTRDRDQLFAEAVVQFDRGVAWWPDDAFESEHIAPQQEARYETDAWQAPIAEWLDRNPEPPLVGEIARGALGFLNQRLGRAEQNRVIAVLERLGYRRCEKKDAQGNVRWEHRSPDDF